MKQIRAYETWEVDLAIQSLHTSQSSSILSAFETSQLSLLKARNDSLLTHQILTWKLKRRVDWINEGDANTKFFDSYASSRRNSKSIWGLQNHFGERIEDDAQLKHLSVSHFSELYSDGGLTNIEDQLKVVRLFPFMVLEEEK